jgi:hypothetical protein
LRSPETQTREATDAGLPSKNGLSDKPRPVAGSTRKILPAIIVRYCDRSAPTSLAAPNIASHPGSNVETFWPPSVKSKCAPSPAPTKSDPSSPNRTVPIACEEWQWMNPLLAPLPSSTTRGVDRSATLPFAL